MAGFNASLKLGGDPKPLAADLMVDQGRLVIKSSDQVIGDWGLKELAFQRVANGFRMDVEGEQLILEMNESAAFEEAIGFKRKGIGRAVKPSRREKAKTQEDKATTGTVTALAATEPSAATSGAASFTERMLRKLDAGLARAEKSYGSLLPHWVFTRRTVWVILAALVVGLVFPTIVSTMLLLLGFAVVVFGAVVYTDDGLAVKVLPGRATATHVLIAGVGLLVMGFALAVFMG